MKWFSLVLALATVVSAAVVPEPVPKPPTTLDLTTPNPDLVPANFTEATQHGTWFIKFYVNYCPHCKRLKPIWQKLAEEFQEYKTTHNFHLGSINCENDQQKFCDEKGSNGYPTLFVFQNGERVEAEYMQGRAYKPLADYIRTKAEKYKPAATPPSPAAILPMETVSLSPSVSPIVQPEKVKESEEPAGSFNREGKSIPLSPDNFASSIKNGPWFIKFYAPWCSHCQHLAPTWEAMAKSLQGKVNVGEVNCEEYMSLCQDHDVAGFPTLQFYLEGAHTTFGGERTEKALVEYALESFGTQHKEVESRHELDQSTANLESWFLYVFDQKTEPSYVEHVRSAARSLFLQSNLFTSQDASLLSGSYAYPRVGSARANVPSLWVFKDNFLRPFTGSLQDKAAIHTWMEAERYPLLPALTSKNADYFFDNTDLLVMVILDTDERRIKPEQLVAWKKEAQKAADTMVTLQTGQSLLDPANAVYPDQKAHFKGRMSDPTYRKFLGMGDDAKDSATSRELRSSKIQFVWVDHTQWDKYLRRVFGVESTDLPAVVITQTKDELYYRLDQNKQPLKLTSSDALISTVQSAVDGLLPVGYTSGILTGTVRKVAQNVRSAGSFAFTHPFMTLIIVLVIVTVVYYFLRGGPSGTYKPAKVD
ncbi:hypothetical protein IWQ62_001609 [Dispira parvispora]|uniref:Thioredoxin domain-containing protein n=1 Tax=Dispira parvispora TaxID=1520584 RepID=A0A9W8AS55_9FUNG|nr:hypothetical protein IWQ62_001609 [Dispira parvispora]